MSNPASNSGDLLDLRKLRRLVELMNEHELGEIDLRNGSVRVRLRKYREAAPAAAGPAAAVPASAPAARAAPAPEAATADDAHLVLIKSIMVGTYYASPSPESPPFVKVGDRVGPDTTVCIVEAMKVFNEIPAGVSGKIAAVLVESGDPVEFGQPLFKVDPRA
jgi:acetyl-CoA carboxylase biotin carboxyl carrier protein